ncbi:MAG: glucose-6-phosphate isomerase [Bacilli bacterium]|jgi:glucose-6-phosphate isomerase|nr:glucose-6-phosphate isomerase [Bacilli bacterium]
MVNFSSKGKQFADLDWDFVDRRAEEVIQKIDDRTGEGNDFLGWTDYASRLPEEDIQKIENAAKKIRKNYEALVVIGIGGSYLGARAVIDAVNGLYSSDKMEILYLGNTLSANYTAQVLKHLEGKKYAINVISKSGTTTEPSVAFRLLRSQLSREFGEEYLKDAIFATTDAHKGALLELAKKEGFETFVVPDDIGGRYSVITPVGLLPIAVSGIDIRKFLSGVKEGEKDYGEKDWKKNPAYVYGATRYLLNVQKKYISEMFVSYEPQFRMITEWLKQLFDESEGKDNQALLATSGIFTTDLHSMGQFIQQGTACLFETVLWAKETNLDIEVPSEKENLDNLNYLAGRKLSYINEKAYLATLDAHTEGHTPANVIEIGKMDAKTLGNLVYFFFRACAFSAYLLNVNPFNQPGVEIYKSNMFKLLGKPAKK